MINYIGAYIVILLVLGLIIERRKYFVVSRNLDTLHPLAVSLLAFTQLLMLFDEGDIFSMSTITPILTWPTILLDGGTLWVHEAGHVFFAPFGNFMAILGGSLNQILFPLLVVGIGAYNRFLRMEALGWYWLGFSLVDLSFYIGDAQERIMPLLGVDVEGHDWHNLLKMTGLLAYDDILASLCYGPGFAFGLVGVIATIYKFPSVSGILDMHRGVGGGRNG